ncbi:MAG TPA: hypothetical protein VF129_04070 [Actinomycetota bacterium]
MKLGIALMAAGTIGVVGLVSTLAAGSWDGTFGIGALSLTPQAAAFAASAVGVFATVSFLFGLDGVVRAGRRRALRAAQDERAEEAERDARARLLAMRLEQLQREVEALEVRRAGELGELDSSLVLIDGDDGDEPVAVVLHDDREPTVLGQRLAKARRSPLPA